jgi:hypothetical protein
MVFEIFVSSLRAATRIDTLVFPSLPEDLKYSRLCHPLIKAITTITYKIVKKEER